MKLHIRAPVGAEVVGLAHAAEVEVLARLALGAVALSLADFLGLLVSPSVSLPEPCSK